MRILELRMKKYHDHSIVVFGGLKKRKKQMNG